MSEMVERVAKALFRSRYPNAESEGFWPDRLDETVNGPPFNAEGYREMARAAIEAMRDPTVAMLLENDTPVGDYFSPEECWQAMIDTALGKVDA